MSQKSTLSFQIELDENKVPVKIHWSSTENSDSGECDATLISIWDKKNKNTLKIDLWTKEMLLDEMKLFFYQTLISMSETLERATSEKNMSKDIQDFAKYFGEKMKIFEQK